MLTPEVRRLITDRIGGGWHVVTIHGYECRKDLLEFSKLGYEISEGSGVYSSGNYIFITKDHGLVIPKDKHDYTYTRECLNLMARYLRVTMFKHDGQWVKSLTFTRAHSYDNIESIKHMADILTTSSNVLVLHGPAYGGKHQIIVDLAIYMAKDIYAIGTREELRLGEKGSIIMIESNVINPNKLSQFLSTVPRETIVAIICYSAEPLARVLAGAHMIKFGYINLAICKRLCEHFYPGFDPNALWQKVVNSDWTVGELSHYMHCASRNDVTFENMINRIA